MKTERALVDTGPLVAILRESDGQHGACSATLRNIRCPAPTCWAVLSEAAWILWKDRRAVRELLRLFEVGVFEILEIEPAASSWFMRFFDKFSDREPQLADASLVYLAEREGIETIFTIDRRDFSVYRTTRGDALRIVPEL